MAAVGLYGAVGYNVAQRTHELAVRAALDARRSDILRLVLGQTALVAIAGFGLGALAALAAAGRIQPVLFRQSARDPFVYAVVAALVIGVAIAASAIPALRAARVDPNLVLRAE